ncbi:hypothetical protein KUCAC02_019971 [Chaenocephalus aceratus]|uniref:Uncharacterized protein n=1 Tax=Chaenocephalus aceratus TaxID=36190 RepID=A0ACB9VQ48_CHAAC|nr:hypothetical protein KUCAC02_019971 [Chaenocephalus aceratus]
MIRCERQSADLRDLIAGPAHRLQHEQGLLAWLSTASGPLASYGELFSPLQLVKLQPRLHLSGVSHGAFLTDTACRSRVCCAESRWSRLPCREHHPQDGQDSQSHGSLFSHQIRGQRERLRRLSVIAHQSSHDAVQAEDSYKCIPRLHLTPPPSLFSGGFLWFLGQLRSACQHFQTPLPAEKG